MSAHADKASNLFMKGSNCSQAVFAAFCDLTGMNETAALKLSSAFGGGVGRMREMCGAVSGMTAVLGALYGYSDFDYAPAKTQTYQNVHDCILKFDESFGTHSCKELLGIKEYVYDPVAKPRTTDFYETRPCLRCIIRACEILDEFIENNPIEKD